MSHVGIHQTLHQVRSISDQAAQANAVRVAALEVSGGRRMGFRQVGQCRGDVGMLELVAVVGGMALFFCKRMEAHEQRNIRLGAMAYFKDTYKTKRDGGLEYTYDGNWEIHGKTVQWSARV